MTEIIEDDGAFRALDDEGEELENSPYDTEKGAKIALNQHKMKTSEEDDEEDTSEMEDHQNEEEEDEEEETSSYSDVSEEEETSSGGGMNMKAVLAIGAVATGAFLMMSGSSETSEPEPEPEPEPQQDEDSRPSAGDMFQ